MESNKHFDPTNETHSLIAQMHLDHGLCSADIADDLDLPLNMVAEIVESLNTQLEQEYEDNYSDVEADADTLASAGWGTDEDYGDFGGEDW